MNLYSKHIGLALLLVFLSSGMMSSTIAAHNLYQLVHNTEQEVRGLLYCQAGHSVVSDSNHPHDPGTLAAADSENETGNVIVNNCNTSLQILSPGSVSLDHFQVAAITNTSVPLLSSQLFVSNIADPPRLA